MLDYKDIIIKYYALGMSGREIARTLSVSKTGVNSFLNAFKECKTLSYPLPEGITNYGIASAVYGSHTTVSGRDLTYELPDYEAVAKDISSRKNMTLVVLWNRYSKKCRDSGLKFYSYRQFCENYAKWCEENKESLHFNAVIGQKMEVDFAGKTFRMVDPLTGETMEIVVFVAVLPYSQYIYAGGSNSISSDSYHAVRCTVPYSNAYDFHGTGTYYTDNNGEGRGFTYIYSSSPYYVAPITQYRYRTRSTYQEINNYGSWSSWGDTYYSNSSSRDVETRTVYRYRTRNPISTYYYYRWKDWSAWSTTAVFQSNTKEVETATFYRYRDRVTQPTYYFQRWTEWSEYFESPVGESDTVEVRTKTQYRYHSK